ncbi:MAG: methyltransferase [Actinophytocola sp.]|uniref:methyltransferase n=1 Tax=Actinophytocola sp. TaxID=1872138 RepID=UPI003C795226
MTNIAADTGTPAGILRLANSFCDAQALLTAVELGLFGTLRAGPAGPDEIRAALELNGRGLTDWLNLLVGLGLLERDGERYRNAPGAENYLVRGGQDYIGGFLERSRRNLYPAWGRLGEALRTGKPQSGGDFLTMVESPGVLRQFADSMDALTGELGTQLIEAYDGWGDYRSMLDVGGCRGYLASRIVRSHPNLDGHVFDLPQMAPLFDELAEESGQAGGLTFHPGDFFVDPLPAADIVIIGHALHDWAPEQRKFLVHKAFDSVHPGGVLLVYDRMLADRSTHIENLVISLDMLLVTDGGSEYTVTELREHAESAGFDSVDATALGDYDTLVVCHKPGEVDR